MYVDPNSTATVAGAYETIVVTIEGVTPGKAAANFLAPVENLAKGGFPATITNFNSYSLHVDNNVNVKAAKVIAIAGNMYPQGPMPQAAVNAFMSVSLFNLDTTDTTSLQGFEPGKGKPTKVTVTRLVKNSQGAWTKAYTLEATGVVPVVVEGNGQADAYFVANAESTVNLEVIKGEEATSQQVLNLYPAVAAAA